MKLEKHVVNVGRQYIIRNKCNVLDLDEGIRRIFVNLHHNRENNEGETIGEQAYLALVDEFGRSELYDRIHVKLIHRAGQNTTT